MQLAVDFLTGNLGSAAEQALAASVVRLVVAGGLIGSVEPLATAQPYSRQQAVALQPVKCALQTLGGLHGPGASICRRPRTVVSAGP